MRDDVLAIGTVVFMAGLGLAFCAGYLAHNMTNQSAILDGEFDAYQGLTITGMIIASVGVGIATYGYAFENHENHGRRIPKSALVIGAVISAFFLGSALWAALATAHMETLRATNPGKYESFQIWSVIGFWVGSLGMVVLIYGFSSNTQTHARLTWREEGYGPRNAMILDVLSVIAFALAVTFIAIGLYIPYSSNTWLLAVTYLVLGPVLLILLIMLALDILKSGSMKHRKTRRKQGSGETRLYGQSRGYRSSHLEEQRPPLVLDSKKRKRVLRASPRERP